MKKILLFIIFPILGHSQIQIGSSISESVTNDNSGNSISLSDNGNVIVIGGPGKIATAAGVTRAFSNEGGIWKRIGNPIYGEMINDQSGRSVSVSGDGSTLAIGSTQPANNSPGTVRIYKNLNGIWNKEATINGEQPRGATGASVSLSYDGNVVAIGATTNYLYAPRAGQVRVLRNISGKWVQIGNYITGKMAEDYSGWSVSLSSSGNIVAIGAPQSNVDNQRKGSVSVYENIYDNWVQIGTDILGLTTNEFSGSNVELSNDGKILAIAARYSPIVRAYQNTGGTWAQIGSDITDPEIEYLGGRSVSLSGDGNVLAVGCPYSYGSIGRGLVRVYANEAGSWKKIGIDIIGEADKDGCGSSVSLSSDGSILAIGAPYNSKKGIDSGNVRVFNLSPLLNNDTFVLSNFLIYPNPSSKDVYIELQSNLDLEKVNIYNTAGQLIRTERESRISVSSLSKGNYFFEVVSNRGKATKIVVVN
ncbi:T9SS type A sorting domain-containing protein [Flavobacterium hibisci]|nr:T9SS type A sorting domain-containing protein [Flavobacterium hibisci]